MRDFFRSSRSDVAMPGFDRGELVILSGVPYFRRVSYFLVTTILVVVGSSIALKELMHFPRDAFYVLPVAFATTALGANTGYHMYFTHKAFCTNKFMHAMFALLGTILCQDSVAQWVANHKRYHRYVDMVDKDPHSPWQFGSNPIVLFTIGLWWSSMGWKFDRVVTSKRFYASKSLEDPITAWFDRHFVVLSYGGFFVPFLVGYFFGGVALGVKWFSYFGALRVFVGYFFTEFVVNGICHLLGASKFRIKGRSTNLALISPVTLGATLHHNHHAFPRALSAAVDREIDPMKLLYLALQKLGWIVPVPDPTPIEVEAKKIRAPSRNEK